MTEPLTSWTRTLNADDALRLVDLAQPGDPQVTWVERAHDALPQGGRDRRTELVRLVRDRLLDWSPSGQVLGTRWLALMHAGLPGARAHLLHGRFLNDEPWIERALTRLIGPRLLAAEAPLASRDLDRVAHSEWVALVAEHVQPGTGPASIRKTRSTLTANLERLGVLTREGPQGVHARLKRGQPAPLAYGWLVAHELKRRGQSEIALHTAVRHSRATLLFQCTEAYASRCLDQAVSAGLFRHSYLAGEDRLVRVDEP